MNPGDGTETYMGTEDIINYIGTWNMGTSIRINASDMGTLARGERALHTMETCHGSLEPCLMCDVSTNCI